MHKATCAACGKSCDVPFRPIPGKAVFCRDCFRRGERPDPKRPDHSDSHAPDPQKRQFEQINAKLDRIIEILEGG
jgi:CxxC-x17-CxxC domain-containing protein